MLICPYLLADLQGRITGCSEQVRAASLVIARKRFQEFLAMCVDLKLVAQREVDIQLAGSLRSSRSLTKSGVVPKTKGLSNSNYKLPRRGNEHSLHATRDYVWKIRRPRSHGSEFEEASRERAILKMKWCIGESFSQISLIDRELGDAQNDG